MPNNDLARYVTEELYWDPKVDSAAIAVSVDSGVVTLRGTVGSFRESRMQSTTPSASTESRTSRTSSRCAS